MAETFSDTLDSGAIQLPQALIFTLDGTINTTTQLNLPAEAAVLHIRPETNAADLYLDQTMADAEVQVPGTDANIILAANTWHALTIKAGVSGATRIGKVQIASQTASTVIRVFVEGRQD